MQIVLHIGQQKTASTSIQRYLANNRGHLARQGILYPSTFGTRKTRQFKHFIVDPKDTSDRNGALNAKLRVELEGDFKKVIFSDETIYPCDLKQTKKRIKNTFEHIGTSWRILCYVRRPDEHIVSQYQQRLSNARADFSRYSSGSFDDFYQEKLDDHYYSYAHHMERWEEVFGAGSVEVRVFHRQTLAQGSPIADFLQWVGANPDELLPDDGRRVNESLDRINSEILYFLYQHHHREPGRIGSEDVQRVWGTTMHALNTGERARLDFERAKRLHAHFREDHERLAARYLSKEHAAVLLAPPVEAPPLPPIARDQVVERMVALFGDRELAEIAADAITDPRPGHRPGPTASAASGPCGRGS
jgi:hypothetical protein